MKKILIATGKKLNTRHVNPFTCKVHDIFDAFRLALKFYHFEERTY